MISPFSIASRPLEATELLDRLVAALELREAADMDSPAWDVEREIRRLEREIAAEWRFRGHAEPRRPPAGDW